MAQAVCFSLGSSLSPLTPSSDSHQSPSPRKATPPHAPGDSAHRLENDAVDAVSPDVQWPAFPDVSPSGFKHLLQVKILTSISFSSFSISRPRPLYWTPALFAPEPSSPKSGPHGLGPPGQLRRATCWLWKRTGSSVTPQVGEHAGELSAVSPFGAVSASKLPVFFCLTETKVSQKDSDSDSEEPTRGPDGGPAPSSQPPRVALFPGVDASALKVSLSPRTSLFLRLFIKTSPRGGRLS